MLGMELRRELFGEEKNPERESLNRGFVLDDQLNAAPLKRGIPDIPGKVIFRYRLPGDPRGAVYYVKTSKSKEKIEESKAKLREKNVFTSDEDIFLDVLLVTEISDKKREGYTEYTEDKDTGRWVKT